MIWWQKFIGFIVWWYVEMLRCSTACWLSSKYVDGCLWYDGSRCFSRADKCDSWWHCCGWLSYYPDIRSNRYGMLTLLAFLICNEHLFLMLAFSLVYKAVIYKGGFVSGRRGVFKLQNCPLAFWPVLNWSSVISTALVSSCVMPKHPLFMM